MCVLTGELDLNTLRVDREIFESGKKKLRIQKYPDTRGWSLRKQKEQKTKRCTNFPRLFVPSPHLDHRNVLMIQSIKWNGHFIHHCSVDLTINHLHSALDKRLAGLVDVELGRRSNKCSGVDRLSGSRALRVGALN